LARDIRREKRASIRSEMARCRYIIVDYYDDSSDFSGADTDDNNFDAKEARCSHRCRRRTPSPGDVDESRASYAEIEFTILQTFVNYYLARTTLKLSR
jgi:hypothetical protein